MAVPIKNAELESLVKLRTIELDRYEREIIERLARAGESKDDATGRHPHRVGRISSVIARCLDQSHEFVELIRRAATLHDVGKIRIPNAVLLKRSRLTDDEVKIIRSHTIIGARLLSGGRSDLIRMARRIARSHHEWWDGSGYPDGLSGTAIPLEARIVGVADYIDALTHDRPYRSASPLGDVLAQVIDESGRHFDPDIVAVITSAECVAELADSAMHQTAEFRVNAAGR
jgi:putative two-component system response regulator